MTDTPKAINIYKGLSIYRVKNSPNWMVRVWDRKRKQGCSLPSFPFGRSLASSGRSAEMPSDGWCDGERTETAPCIAVCRAQPEYSVQ